MKTFGAYPMLAKSIVLMAHDAGIELRADWPTLEVPAKYAELAPQAEAAAIIMSDKPLAYFIPADMVDNVVADPADNALETFATGEDSASQALKLAVAGGEALDEILASAFEGDLAAQLQQ